MIHVHSQVIWSGTFWDERYPFISATYYLLMGSYLTVVNNTPDKWHCRVGADVKAIRIAGVILTVMGAITGAISTAGAVAPFATGLAVSGTTTVFGISTTSLMTITAAASGTPELVASVVGGISGFSMAVARIFNNDLDENGYDTIFAGEKRQYGKMALSLWQQSVCIKTTMCGNKVQVETLFMRPIFSGATYESNKDYEIQGWIDKHGTIKDVIEGKNETKH